MLICSQLLVIVLELIVFATASLYKHSRLFNRNAVAMSDNVHISQFMLSAVCRLIKLLLVWELLSEPLITACAIPFAFGLREALNRRTERKSVIKWQLILCASIVSLALLIA